jgi:cell division protein FtsI/penicillin-binding protein 2
MRSSRWAFGLALALGAGAVAGTALAGCAGGPVPQSTASSFLAAWTARDWPAMRALVASPPADFAAVNAAALADLGVTKASYQAGKLRVSGSTAREPVTEHLVVASVGDITISSTLRLAELHGKWLVDWSPGTIAPQLKPGDQLSLQVTWPPRAQILGTGDAPLTTQAAMVIIGVEGQRIKSAKTVQAALLKAGATSQQVSTALAGAKAEPSWFEPVFTVTQARYNQLASAIYPVPGTVFETETQRTPITTGLDDVVGTVGPITAQELKQLGAPYNAQSVVGQTGLELADQGQLAGHPGATVTVVDAAGTQLATVARLLPRPGKPVLTTIDPVVQRAAEAALAGERKSAGFVAVNAVTGGVLASVSQPASPGFNMAFEGGFPPGSSFKLITSTALITHGLTPSSRASCPSSVTVDGEVFHNAEGTAPISDLLHAFAESCNTAFIGLATRNLTAADFPAAASLYRLGTTPEMGVPAFGGSVPEPTDEADLAATAIGQGRVLVSPLAMAMIAAAIDTGFVHAPLLVDGAPDRKVPATPLPSTVVTDLHTMMAQVVATGTASGKGLPPGTFAKTGTAQYGSGNPLPTDAWLVGFNGTVAFAMVVVDGGEGGPTDGPLVARFLDLLRQGD